MAITPTVPAALGAIAFLPTTAMLAIHVILARSPADRASSVRTTATAAAAFEGIIFIAIPFLSISHMAPWAPRGRCFRGIWFGAGLTLSTVATALSVSNIVCLSRVVDDPSSTILGWKAGDFLVGSSVVLGLAFATQLVFFVLHFIVGRALGSHPELSTHPDHAHKLAPRIKTVLYHETTPVSTTKDRGSASFDSPTPPGPSAGRSRTDTMSSIRNSLSHAIRPITSRTRLLSVSRRSSRAPSLDLPGPRRSRSRSNTTEEGFDSWDTSAVDPENRQTVLESSSPPPTRFLETIPASPTTSRSPSPGTPLDVLEPPPARTTRRRSRSYSPVSSRTIQAQRAAFTQQASHSEAHIHPLFRSDSPVPPPSATPGTVVVAAPNAGQVISDRQSIRSIASMRRLRSDSSPAVPSPLGGGAVVGVGRVASCESFSNLHRRGESSSPEVKEEMDEEGEGEEDDVERKMTPPIPEWILGAGSRSSLTVYKSRRSLRESRSGEDVSKGSGEQRAST